MLTHLQAETWAFFAAVASRKVPEDLDSSPLPAIPRVVPSPLCRRLVDPARVPTPLLRQAICLETFEIVEIAVGLAATLLDCPTPPIVESNHATPHLEAAAEASPTVPRILSFPRSTSTPRPNLLPRRRGALGGPVAAEGSPTSMDWMVASLWVQEAHPDKSFCVLCSRRRCNTRLGISDICNPGAFPRYCKCSTRAWKLALWIGVALVVASGRFGGDEVRVDFVVDACDFLVHADTVGFPPL